mgnify:CR=1 FL=1
MDNLNLPVRVIYTENGVEKTSFDENRRQNEILEHNQRLNKWFWDRQRQRNKTENNK